VRALAFEAESGPVERRLATGLAKIGLAIKHGAWHEARARGLSPTQAQLLVLLLRGRATLTDLARELGVGVPTASEALRVLADKRLVRKGRSTADGRALAVTLTPAGRREADRLAGWPDFLLDALDALGPPEQEGLLSTVVKLIAAMQERGRIPVARMCVTCRFFRPDVHDDAERPHHCAFVDAAFGDRSLRLDCPDHDPRSDGPDPTHRATALA